MHGQDRIGPGLTRIAPATVQSQRCPRPSLAVDPTRIHLQSITSPFQSVPIRRSPPQSLPDWVWIIRSELRCMAQMEDNDWKASSDNYWAITKTHERRHYGIQNLRSATYSLSIMIISVFISSTNQLAERSQLPTLQCSVNVKGSRCCSQYHKSTWRNCLFGNAVQQSGSFIGHAWFRSPIRLSPSPPINMRFTHRVSCYISLQHIYIAHALTSLVGFIGLAGLSWYRFFCMHAHLWLFFPTWVNGDCIFYRSQHELWLGSDRPQWIQAWLHDG